MSSGTDKGISAWGLPQLNDALPEEPHQNKRTVDGGAPPPDGGPAPPMFSDDDLALRFAAEYKDELRYCAPFGRWFRWRDEVWREDRTHEVFDSIRKVCRAVAAECNTGKAASQIASAKTVWAIHNLARADRRLAVSDEVWDRDIWALNTPAGIVDLRTGDIRPARREDYCTRMTSVAPSGDCPVWRTFLARITDGDVGLQLYLQRVAGYALTGSVREHAIIFLYGTGGNGKSVFLGTLARILDGYATTAPAELFTETRFDQHPTSLASLKGARLVTSSETESGRRWAEAKLTRLTGGDRIKARFMRRDDFVYDPQFTLIIAGNHKPGLRSVNEAIRRRFHLVPFTVTIPRAEQGSDLPESLRAEADGILSWAIEGAIEWCGEGLAPPESVWRATEEYLEAEDALAEWLASECATDDLNAFTSTTALYDNWRRWAETSGEYPSSKKWLSQTLEDRGFKYRKTNRSRGFVGLRIGEPVRAPNPDKGADL